VIGEHEEAILTVCVTGGGHDGAEQSLVVVRVILRIGQEYDEV